DRAPTSLERPTPARRTIGACPGAPCTRRCAPTSGSRATLHHVQQTHERRGTEPRWHSRAADPEAAQTRTRVHVPESRQQVAVPAVDDPCGDGHVHTGRIARRDDATG